jgi:hypothetical protein
MTTEVIWAIIGFLLTVMVISYLAGDNPFFRLATYLFIGVTSGFITLTVLTQVLWPRLALPLLTGNIQEKLLTLVPLILSMLLLLKISPRLARFGNIPLAYLVGIGAAVTIGGAIFGTLFPQVIGTINLFDLQAGAAQDRTPVGQLLVGLFILVGTVTTLMYFYFGARSAIPNQSPKRSALIETLAQGGQVFIGITLGALFAGVYSAALSALIERAASILNLISIF